MRNKFFLLPLGILLIALVPFPSRGEEIERDDPKIAQVPEGAVKDKTTNPGRPGSNPSQKEASSSEALDPESQVAPAVKIQESTNAEG
jgi:hypothetical protein